MSNGVDPYLVQKILTVSSDIISAKIAGHEGGLPDEVQQYPRLKRFLPKRFLENVEKVNLNQPLLGYSPTEVTEYLQWQNSLTSRVPMLDPELASTFFSSDVSEYYNGTEGYITNGKTDNNYSMHFRMYMHVSGNAYFFDIDEFNNKSIKDINKQGCIIESVEIQNDGKDAATAKTSYNVVLKILFNKYEDLVEKSINIRLENGATPKNGFDKEYKICPLNLLYKFYDADAALNRKYSSSEGVRLVEPLGYVLNQKLKLYNPKTIEQLVASTGGLEELNKNYEIGHIKHEFNMFQDDDVLTTPYKNSLTIVYGGREISNNYKIQLEDSDTITNASIYSVLRSKKYTETDVFKQTFKGISSKDTIDDFWAEIDSVNGIILDNQQKLSSGGISDTEATEAINAISQATSKIKELKKKLKSLVLSAIVNKFRVYTIPISYKTFGIWTEINAWQTLRETFNFKDAAIATTLGTASGVLLATKFPNPWAAAATIVGSTILGAASYDGYNKLETYRKVDLRKVEINAKIARREIYSKINECKTDPDPLGKKLVYREISDTETDAVAGKESFGDVRLVASESGLWQSVTSAYDRAKNKLVEYFFGLPTVTGKVGFESLDLRSQRKLVATYSSDLSVNIPTETELSGYANVRFILFQEIIKLLMDLDPTQKLLILCFNHFFKLGEFIPTDASINELYLGINYAHLPISLEMFMIWFNREFMENELADRYYDTEMFVSSAYENILKPIMIDGQTALSIAKGSIGSEFKLESSVHEDTPKLKEFAEEPELFVPFEGITYNRIAQIMQRSNRLTNANSLRKITTIGSVQEISGFNYFDDFKDFKTVLNKNIKNAYKNLSLEEKYAYAFERYINKVHLLPCITILDVVMAETFLKSKNVKFRRYDSPNLQTGYIEAQGAFLRGQYQFTGRLKPYMSHFIDMASNIFVVPPYSAEYSNMLGYGGLYFVLKTKLNYKFQLNVGGKMILPSYDSEYEVEASMISYGEGPNIDNTITRDIIKGIG